MHTHTHTLRESEGGREREFERDCILQACRNISCEQSALFCRNRLLALQASHYKCSLLHSSYPLLYQRSKIVDKNRANFLVRQQPSVCFFFLPHPSTLLCFLIASLLTYILFLPTLSSSQVPSFPSPPSLLCCLVSLDCSMAVFYFTANIHL